MREILFRGKRTDNGKWVYGSFCMDARELLKGLCGVDGFIRRYEPNKGQVQMYEVDRETVGQFTGLTDKNGKQIFEGDIVRHNERLYTVAYVTKHARFAGTAPGCVMVIFPFGKCEVIGNIHDNPELITEDS